MGRVQDDVAFRDPVLAGDPAPDGSGVLAAEAGEVRGDEHECLVPRIAERERARPDRVVDALGQPVSVAKRHVGTEARQVDPPEAIAIRIELRDRGVRRRVVAQHGGDVDGRRAGLELAGGRGRPGEEEDEDSEPQTRSGGR